MSFSRIPSSVLWALVVVASLAHPVSAQDQEQDQEQTIPLKIAIIDVDAIQRNAVAVKEIRSQIGKYRSAFQADIQKEETELRNANQELARQRTILSPEAFAEERRKFEQRLITVQQKVQLRKQELEKAQIGAMRQVQAALNEIITGIAKERKLTLILRENQVVLSATALKITDEVLARLDQKLPSISVPEPGK